MLSHVINPVFDAFWIGNWILGLGFLVVLPIIVLLFDFASWLFPSDTEDAEIFVEQVLLANQARRMK